MEATGAYWERLALSLVQAGFILSVIHSPQAHDFAKALLKRAKTDTIDAQTLAQFAERFEPAPWTPPAAISVALEQRLQEREAWLTCRKPGAQSTPYPLASSRDGTRGAQENERGY